MARSGVVYDVFRISDEPITDPPDQRQSFVVVKVFRNDGAAWPANAPPQVGHVVIFKDMRVSISQSYKIFKEGHFWHRYRGVFGCCLNL